MKTLLFLLASAVAVAEVTTALDYAPGYAFRGVKSSGAFLQPAVNVQFGTGYAGAWANQSLERRRDTEVDLTLGNTLAGWLDFGVTAYTYGVGDRSLEPYVGVTFDFGKGFKASLYGFRDTTLHTKTVELKIKVIAVGDLSFEGAIGHSEGRELSAYRYWSFGPTFNHKLSDRLAFTASVQFVSSSDRSFERDFLTGKTGFAFSF